MRKQKDGVTINYARMDWKPDVSQGLSSWPWKEDTYWPLSKWDDALWPIVGMHTLDMERAST